MINKFFKVGNVSLSGSNLARYRVRSREELKVIIDHFNKYPLHLIYGLSRIFSNRLCLLALGYMV